jgi:hypothetical protein
VGPSWVQLCEAVRCLPVSDLTTSREVLVRSAEFVAAWIGESLHHIGFRGRQRTWWVKPFQHSGDRLPLVNECGEYKIGDLLWTGRGPGELRLPQQI